MEKEVKAHNSLYFICVFMILLFFGSPNVSAGTIGKGRAEIFNNNSGSARKQAIQNALRDAVEQGVGVLIDAKTQVKNWAVIRDEVFTSSRGFVKKYSILKDEQQKNIWYVEIDAELSKGDIKNKLEELRILHKKMGNKRIMVTYFKEHPDSLEEKHNAVLTALSFIPAEFNRSGFRVFDQRSLGYISDKTSPSGALKEQWIKIADEHQVDVLVEFELLPGKKRPFSNSMYTAAKITLRMKVYDVSTGRLFSNVQSNQKQMTNARVGSFDWENALSKAAERAGTSATKETVDNIVEYYKSVGDIGNSYLLIFQNFIEDEEDIILEVLEGLDGFQSLSELKNIPKLLKVEYFSTVEKSRLRRKIRLACKAQKVKLKTREIAGNRLIFVKP